MAMAPPSRRLSKEGSPRRGSALEWLAPVRSQGATSGGEIETMAKGQVRGNKEAKKPKKEKPKTIAANPPTVKIGTTEKKK